MVKYALLFSGRTEYRHVCDLEELYRSLVRIHEFNPENIYTLLYYGKLGYEFYKRNSTLKHKDNTPYALRVSDNGTLEGFDRTINLIKGQLKPKDLLFIHTNGHGGESGSEKLKAESNLWTSMGPSITASHLGLRLQDLPQIKILHVMMGQCYSGGFAESVISNSTATYTSFSSATSGKGLSIGEEYGNTFVMKWIYGISNSKATSFWDVHKYASKNTHVLDKPVFIDYPIESSKTIGLNLLPSTQ